MWIGSSCHTTLVLQDKIIMLNPRLVELTVSVVIKKIRYKKAKNVYEDFGIQVLSEDKKLLHLGH